MSSWNNKRAYISYAAGILGIFLTIFGWCLIRHLSSIRSPKKLYQIAKICFIICALKILCAVLEFIYAAWFWPGLIFILFALFWLMKGSRARKAALKLLLNGYEPFQDGNVSSADAINNNNDMNSNLLIHSSALLHSETNDLDLKSYESENIAIIDINELHPPMILARKERSKPQPIIRNAVHIPLFFVCMFNTHMNAS